MLNEAMKQKLIANWPKAESMACYAEMRVYDPLSSWQCYILALNPEDENLVNCIISVGKCFKPQQSIWTIEDIFSSYNSSGEHPQIDHEFRPRLAAELFKKLNNGIIYDSSRD